MPAIMPSIAPSQIASSAASAIDASHGGFRSSGRGMTSVPVSKSDRFSDALLSDQQFSREQATTAYERSSLEAQKQRDWEERMSNTAYKRAAAQLRELGINPYVLLSGFSAASTPQGASGTGHIGQSVSATSARASQYSTEMRFVSSLIGTVANFLASMSNSAMRSASAAFMFA